MTLTTEFSPSKNLVHGSVVGEADPTAAGLQILADWNDSVESVIRVGVGVHEGVRAFEHDPERFRAFLAPLIEGSILTANEAKLGRSAPKISKLLKIGENEGLLRSEGIFSRLTPEYTLVYQVCVLSDEIARSQEPETVVTEIAQFLARSPLSREALLEETRRRKQVRKTAPSEQTEMASRPEGGADPQTMATLVEGGQQFDLILITPGEEDLKRLRQDYAELGALEACLPFGRLTGGTENVAVVVVVRLSDLGVIEARLLPLCGFDRPSGIILPRRPTSPDITRAEVVITASRPNARLRRLDADSWTEGAGPIDFASLAKRLYPDAVRRLHVFATGQTDGWHSVVSIDSWIEKPSRR